MNENKVTRWGVFVTAFITTSLAICGLVWNFGLLTRTLQQHSAEISRLEMEGSVIVQKHIIMDDTRFNALSDRVAKLELLNGAIAALQVQMGATATKIDNLSAHLDHVIMYMEGNSTAKKP